MNETRIEGGDGSDPGLSGVLRTWRVDAEAPPRFEEGVWRRIEAGRVGGAAWGPGRWLEGLLSGWFRRPMVAAGFVGCVLVVGATAGAVSGQARADALAVHLEGRYVQSIDPFSGPAR